MKQVRRGLIFTFFLKHLLKELQEIEIHTKGKLGFGKYSLYTEFLISCMYYKTGIFFQVRRWN